MTGGRLAIALSVLVAAGTAAAPANAGTTYGDLDLSYTSTGTNWPIIPARGEQSTYDPCESPGRLAGMGAYIRESVPSNPGQPTHSAFPIGRAYNVSIYPEDQYAGGPAPDSTHQVADYRAATNANSVTQFESTVCSPAIDPVSYPSAARRSPKRSRTTVSATCKGGSGVISGGAFASGPFRSQRLVSSAPFDSGDAGKRPDDGWRVTVDNLSKKRLLVRAHAICTKVAGFSYRTKAFRSSKRSRRHTDAACPPGEFVVGGGVRHTARRGKATLVASGYTGLDPDHWFTEVDNLSRKRAAGVAFAICHD